MAPIMSELRANNEPFRSLTESQPNSIYSHEENVNGTHKHMVPVLLQITPQCPEGVVCLLLQSLTGLLLSTSLLGLIFAKLSRPRPRSQTVMFSKHAVVAPYDGFLSLMFRVGDARKSQLLDVAISLHCFRFRTTSTGEEFLVSQQELPITTEHGIQIGEHIKPFFLMPLTVVHVIDERSPLYELGAQELATSRIEIIAVLEGVIESTSMVTQAKTSYLAEEILWGQRFHPISLSGAKKADLSSFDKTYRVHTPLFSAKEYERSNHKGIKDDEYKTSAKEKADLSNGGDCPVWIPMEPEPESSTRNETCNNHSDIA